MRIADCEFRISKKARVNNPLVGVAFSRDLNDFYDFYDFNDFNGLNDLNELSEVY